MLNEAQGSAFVGTAARSFDFVKIRKQLSLIEALRMGLLFVLLLTTIALQAAQPYFINLGIVLPTYGILFAAFFVHGFFILGFEERLQTAAGQSAVFLFDALSITGLLYFTELNHAFFLFLYFIHIALCGYVFGRSGAIALASVVSILYSLILTTSPEFEGQGLVLALGLNNIAFFCVAYFSGSLSEQLTSLGKELSKHKRGMKEIRDLNKSIVEHVGSGILSIDAMGTVLQCNEEGARIVGAAEGEIVGQNIHRVLPLHESFLDVRNWNPSSQSVQRQEMEIKNAKHQDFILEVIASPIFSGESVVGFVILFHDMTQVRKLEFSMRQAEKLAAVGQLAAGIAHEIRNPLASISGSVQLLETLEEGAEERSRLMRIVIREIDRLNGMISEFLDYVKPDQPIAKKVNLSGLANEVLDMVQLNDRLPKNVRQIREIVPDVWIKGEEGKLKQAFLNIIINAYQAMEKSENAEVKVTVVADSPSVLFKVRDNGSGMDEATRLRIFEPFHTTKPRGTGLGLAITHKILENHGAKIFVKSELGIGTEFTIQFKEALEHDVKKTETGSN